MKLYVEKERDAWNRVVESSPYSVLHHKYEVFSCEDNELPLVFEEGDNRILFPFTVGNFFGLKLVTVPASHLASLLPNRGEAIALVPKALDTVFDLLRKTGFDFMVVSNPFFYPEQYVDPLHSWFEAKDALVQPIYAHVLSTKRSFEDIWMKGFSKHARNRARKAEKEGVIVEEVRDFDEWISDMYRCNMSSFYRQKRYPRYPHSNKEAFLTYLNFHRKMLGGNFKVYGAFFDSRLIAYMATMEFNKLIILMLMMSVSEFMSKCPNNALLKYVVQHACEGDFEWVYYSFDRASSNSDRPSLYPSLRRFKFEHGFVEAPMNVYYLELTKLGTIYRYLLSLYSSAFVSSAILPQYLVDMLQKVYEKRKYKRSEISEFLSRKMKRVNMSVS